MRIAVVADSISRKNGGITAVVHELCRQYAAFGHEVILFGIEDEYSKCDCESAGVEFRTAPVRLNVGLRYAPKLRKLLLDFAPDIIHVHGIWSYSGIVCSSLGIPYVVSSHGMLDKWALRQSAFKKKLFSLFFEHRMLRRASAVCALCESESRSIKDFQPELEPVVIPNGVTIPDEDSPLPTADGKKELLYLGRLHPKKGAQNLIPAFLKTAPPDWRLVIAGWDQECFRSRLAALAGDSPNVVFAGPLFGDDKIAALRRCSAFVLPSYSEGLPMAVLEAWSYRKPALITEHCNLPEGFEADAAIRIDTECDELAEDLQRFFALPEARLTEIGENARLLASGKFRWDSVASRYIELYRKLTGKTDRGGEPSGH